MHKSLLFQRLVVVFLFLFFQSSFAIEYGGFGGRPAYPRADNPRTESIFVHTLEPGAVQKEGITVINNSSESKTVLIYAADSTPSTGGAFACKQFSEENTDVGSWIKLTKSEIVLSAGSTQLVPFTITIPANASVGEHNGCILIQEKKPKKDGQPGVNLSIRTGLRVAITVPGDIERKLEIDGFDYKRQKGIIILSPRVGNIGNVSIDAGVSVVTRHFFGLKYSEQGGEYPVLRGETSDWNFDLQKPFFGGLYRSKFTVSYDPSPEAQIGDNTDGELTILKGPSIWFIMFPTLLGFITQLILLGLVGALIFLYIVARRREQWIINHWVKKTLTASTDITSLAEEYNVSWKLLAKVNRLKPPYTLKKGDALKVPPHK
ncbi:DUF916 domain-containing protein [Candidatus Gracilibacteria bacterium]|nr:DUF916 domain-containing protein [Candidatus Gracilibacteria bacterium]